jgi:RNA-directed DNA polymerase
MNEAKQTKEAQRDKFLRSLCGPGFVNWNSIKWGQFQRNVSRLQARIVKAEKEGRIGKVKALQIILTKSLAARAMAVKRVTENQGKNTPGVDGSLWKTPDSKVNAVQQLRRKGYKASALKRVYIPKTNGKKRPLGIPTMKDRAMQALHQMALDPVAECRADVNSYGFRKNRSTADAIEKCFAVLSRKRAVRWILEGDIKGCFDNIDHQWLLENIPADRRMLNEWLDAGFVHKGTFHATEAGTPQGGIISPVLANMALDGLEKALQAQFGIKQSAQGRASRINLVRYADDFIITGKSQELLENEVKPLVQNFLAKRGLTLSAEKTNTTYIKDGFDFLGQNVRKYGDKLLIKPSRKSIANLLEKVQGIIKGHKTATSGGLIIMLNPIIRGWVNYHHHVVSSRVFARVDHAIWQAIWAWAIRRHPNKSKVWVRSKYFTTERGNNWAFFGVTGNGKRVLLFKATSISIKRHVKVRQDLNPYDPAWKDYLVKRVAKSSRNSGWVPQGAF